MGTRLLSWCLPASRPHPSSFSLARPSRVEGGDGQLALPTDRAWKEVFNLQEEEKVMPPEAMRREGAPEIL